MDLNESQKESQKEENKIKDEDYIPSNTDIFSDFRIKRPKGRKIKKKIFCRYKCKYCRKKISCSKKYNHMIKFHYNKCNKIQRLNYEFNNSVKYLRKIIFYKSLLMKSEKRIKQIKLSKENKKVLLNKSHFLKYQIEYKNEMKQSLERLIKNNNKNLLNELVIKSELNQNNSYNISYLNESEANLSQIME